MNKRELILLIPTKEDVEGLQVGDLALNAFGRFRPVVEISARREDIHGAPFVCFYTRTTETGSMSASYKVGRLVRHAGCPYTSSEMDQIEREMKSNGERMRVVTFG